MKVIPSFFPDFGHLDVDLQTPRDSVFHHKSMGFPDG